MGGIHSHEHPVFTQESMVLRLDLISFCFMVLASKPMDLALKQHTESPPKAVNGFNHPKQNSAFSKTPEGSSLGMPFQD